MNSEVGDGLRDRIRECAQIVGSGDELARRSGISRRTLERYLTGQSQPKAGSLAAIAEAASVSLDWLILGHKGTSATQGGDVYEDAEMVPHFDLAMSAGGGAFNDRTAIRDFIPFPREILRRLVGRASADGLAIVDARGDSMEPTFGDGDIVLIDTRDNTLQDGLMAFGIDDIAYIKRLRPLPGDGVEVISDNETYKPFVLARDRLADLRIFGRVRWVGRAL